MSESRRIVMVHALEVAVGVRTESPKHVFTENVSAWSPNLMASSLEELEEALDDRNAALGVGPMPGVELDGVAVDGR